jgi:predicted MFS family arabinose efflux permease
MASYLNSYVTIAALGDWLLELTSPRAAFDVVGAAGTLVLTLLVWALLPRPTEGASPSPRVRG